WGKGVIEGVGRGGQAGVWRHALAVLPNALIDRVETAVAGIVNTQTPPASATEQQALQQTQTFSDWSGENFEIGAVGRQPLAVGEELLPTDVSSMVIMDK